MNGFLVFGIASAWLVILAGCWLGWQLLRQNGRLLLRVEELEKRLDELEFGEADNHQSEEALDSQSEVGSRKSAVDQSLVTSTLRSSATEDGSAATNGEGRANRFGNRSLARSKIKRDGLKVGTPAPDFRLPLLDGSGELALSELRGKRVLLVFSSPHCGPCSMLAPELEKFHRATLNLAFPPNLPASERPLTPSLSPDGGEGVRRTGEGESQDVVVVMIGRGEPKENRAKVKEHGLTFPIVLQQQWEISRRYAMFATPIAYLIDEAGVIVNHVAVGIDAIRILMLRTEKPVRNEPPFLRSEAVS